MIKLAAKKIICLSWFANLIKKQVGHFPKLEQVLSEDMYDYALLDTDFYREKIIKKLVVQDSARYVFIYLPSVDQRGKLTYLRYRLGRPLLYVDEHGVGHLTILLSGNNHFHSCVRRKSTDFSFADSHRNIFDSPLYKNLSVEDKMFVDDMERHLYQARLHYLQQLVERQQQANKLSVPVVPSLPVSLVTSQGPQPLVRSLAVHTEQLVAASEDERQAWLEKLLVTKPYDLSALIFVLYHELISLQLVGKHLPSIAKSVIKGYQYYKKGSKDSLSDIAVGFENLAFVVHMLAKLQVSLRVLQLIEATCIQNLPSKYSQLVKRIFVSARKVVVLASTVEHPLQMVEALPRFALLASATKVSQALQELRELPITVVKTPLVQQLVKFHTQLQTRSIHSITSRVTQKSDIGVFSFSQVVERTMKLLGRENRFVSERFVPALQAIASVLNSSAAHDFFRNQFKIFNYVFQEQLGTSAINQKVKQDSVTESLAVSKSKGNSLTSKQRELAPLMVYLEQNFITESLPHPNYRSFLGAASKTIHADNSSFREIGKLGDFVDQLNLESSYGTFVRENWAAPSEEKFTLFEGNTSKFADHPDNAISLESELEQSLALPLTSTLKEESESHDEEQIINPHLWDEMIVRDNYWLEDFPVISSESTLLANAQEDQQIDPFIPNPEDWSNGFDEEIDAAVDSDDVNADDEEDFNADDFDIKTSYEDLVEDFDDVFNFAHMMTSMRQHLVYHPTAEDDEEIDLASKEEGKDGVAYTATAANFDSMAAELTSSITNSTTPSDVTAGYGTASSTSPVVVSPKRLTTVGFREKGTLGTFFHQPVAVPVEKQVIDDEVDEGDFEGVLTQAATTLIPKLVPLEVNHYRSFGQAAVVENPRQSSRFGAIAHDVDSTLQDFLEGTNSEVAHVDKNTHYTLLARDLRKAKRASEIFQWLGIYLNLPAYRCVRVLSDFMLANSYVYQPLVARSHLRLQPYEQMVYDLSMTFAGRHVHAHISVRQMQVLQDYRRSMQQRYDHAGMCFPYLFSHKCLRYWLPWKCLPVATVLEVTAGLLPVFDAERAEVTEAVYKLADDEHDLFHVEKLLASSTTNNGSVDMYAHYDEFSVNATSPTNLRQYQTRKSTVSNEPQVNEKLLLQAFPLISKKKVSRHKSVKKKE